MFKRIDIVRIIKDHFKTLRRLDSDKKSIYWKDFVLFLVFPIFLGTFLVYQEISIQEYVGNLIAAISIFGGFLFNLLAIIYSQIDKIKTDAQNENSSLKKRFINEIHINISYSIVLSLIIVVALLASTSTLPAYKFDWLVKNIFLGCIYFLLINFLLTLLMVLNRVYILLKKDSE
jgi:hypothetical protein